jgi:tetratricopeptide (TPR) repeat protein
MVMLRRALAFALFLLCLQGPLRGSAAPPPDAAERAQTLFSEGLALSGARRWVDAREAFRRSIALVPRASTYFNLGIACLELQLGREALDALDAFDKLADAQAHARFRATASELRARAQALVATLVLSVQPASASVLIDGEGFAGGAQRIVFLHPGSHRVEVNAEGYLPTSFEVDLSVRNTYQRRVELSAKPALPALAASRVSLSTSGPPLTREAAPVPDRKSPVWRKPALWIAVGVVIAAGIGVGLGVGLTRKQQSEEAEPYRGSTGWEL